MRGWVLSVLRLACRRLRSRPGLTLLSLAGITLAVALAAGVPVFSQGVSYLVLREELDRMEHAAGRPACAVRFYYLPSEQRPLGVPEAQGMEAVLRGLIAERIDLPIAQSVRRLESGALTLRPAGGSAPAGGDDAVARALTCSAFGGVAEHVEVVDGAPFGQIGRDDRLALWAHEETANAFGLNPGDEYDLVDGRGSRILAYVAGIWRARDPADPYWYEDPASALGSTFLVTESDYLATVQSLQPAGAGFASWYFVLDERAFSVAGADGFARGLGQLANAASSRLPEIRMDYSPLEPLARYRQRRSLLASLLVGFSLPGAGLLLYFLSLISLAAGANEREEIAILSSRGGGRLFILALLGVEAGLLVALGAALGLGLSLGVAQAMGYSQSFLAFVRRPALPVSLRGLDLRLFGAAVLMLLLARLVPSWQAARESVVTHLRRRSRPAPVRVFSLLMADLGLCAVTAYAYYQLSERGAIGIIGWEPAGDPFRDPLLLLAPSLFILTVSLMVAHLFPLWVRPVDWLGQRTNLFPAYMGLRHLVRQSGQYAGALFLVVICLGLGTFYSSMAHSLDRWLCDRIYYQVGADLSFKQGLPQAAQGAGMQAQPVPASEEEVEGGWLLPVSVYLEIPGVTRAARVGEFPATAVLLRPTKGRFLGVDRLDFPLVAFWRDDFAPVSLGELMNRLAAVDNGLLVSRRFLQGNLLSEGQPVDLDVRVGSSMQQVRLRIVGVYDYFPTVYTEQ